MLLSSDPLQLSLYNSELTNSPIYAQRMRWSGSIQTVRKEDIDEPNDDDNQTTRTDRTLGSPLTLGTQIDRSFYRRSTGTAEDLEDWYSFSGTVGRTYTMDFTNQNGVWSVFTFVARLIDSDGNTITYFSGHKTAGTRQLIFTADATETYYVQVYGAPSTRQGTSVFYAPYSVKVSELPQPEVSSVNIEGGFLFSGASYQVSLTSPGTPIAWAWNFGEGARPKTSALASPTIKGAEPGQHQASVIITTASGTSAPYPFTYYVQATGNWWLESAPIGRVVGTWELPGNRLGFINDSGYFAYSGANGDLSSWNSYDIEPLTSLFIKALAPEKILGKITAATSSGEYYRALVDVPTSSADWYVSTIPLSVTPSWMAASNVGSRIGIAYCAYPGSTLYWSNASSAAPGPGDWTEHQVDNSGLTYGLGGLKYGVKPALVYLKGAGANVAHSPSVIYARAKIGAPTSAADWTLTPISTLSNMLQSSDIDHWTRTVVATPTRLLVGGGAPGVYGFIVMWSKIQEPILASDWAEDATIVPVTGPQNLTLPKGAVTIVGGRVHVAFEASTSPRTSYVFSSVETFPFADTADLSWVQNGDVFNVVGDFTFVTAPMLGDDLTLLGLNGMYRAVH